MNAAESGRYPPGGAPEEDPPLSEREQLMMAYVDHELAPRERLRFEKLMADDPGLAAEVADYRTMLDLSHGSGRLEPTEAELRRFWGRFYNRAEWRLGWVLLVGGVACLAGFGCWELYCADFPWVLKIGSAAIVAGGGLLLASTVRQRLRTRRLDRYRGVVR